MRAAMETDANAADPDATVDLRPPAAPTPSNNRTLTAAASTASDRTISTTAGRAAGVDDQPSISELQHQQADDSDATRDMTTDAINGEILDSISHLISSAVRIVFFHFESNRIVELLFEISNRME